MTQEISIEMEPQLQDKMSPSPSVKATLRAVSNEVDANNNDGEGNLNNDFHTNEEGLGELDLANDHGNGVHNGEAGEQGDHEEDDANNNDDQGDHVDEDGDVLPVFLIGKRTIFGLVEEEDTLPSLFIGDRFIFEVGDETEEAYQFFIQKQGDQEEVEEAVEEDYTTDEEEEEQGKNYDEDEDEEEEVDFGLEGRFNDIIFYKEKKYAARRDGKVFVSEIITSNGPNNGASLYWRLLRTTWKLKLKLRR